MSRDARLTVLGGLELTGMYLTKVFGGATSFDGSLPG